jgi:small-conductance mechanosensitive channel
VLFLISSRISARFVREDGTTPEIFTYIEGGVYVLVVLFIASFLSRLIHLVLDAYSTRIGKVVGDRVRDEFAPLLRRIISIVIYVIAIIQILHHFNQDINSILVSLGVGSLAVALAAKDTIANMIAGFTIMTDRPFRIGDRILLDSGEKGDVFDIGIRTTKIRTFDNTLIIVPNQQIVNEKLTNLTYPDPRIRVRIDVGVAYGTDLDKAKNILVDICTAHPEVLDDPVPAAYFTEFGESSLDLMVVCRIAEWENQWRVGEELRMEIKKVFGREGIEIPFPQRDLHIKKD